MSVISDFVLNPLVIIDQLFEENNNINGEIITEYFKKFVEEKNALTQIPSVNDVAPHNMKTGSLIHYRCMIQDMFDPELFLGTYEVCNVKTGQRQKRCGMYRDLLNSFNEEEEEIDFDTSRNRTMDRQILYCIPIPGENAWVKETYANMRSKSEMLVSSSDEIVLQQLKRIHDEEGESKEIMDFDGNVKKRQKCTTSSIDDNNKSNSFTYDSNFPLQTERGPACIIKIYNPFADLKLNEMIEVIGILSTDPDIVLKSTDDLPNELTEVMDISEEENVRNPPPSLVPRIHAVLVQRLNNNNPYLHRDAAILSTICDDDFEVVRQEVLAVFEQMLFGDRLSAEYLLCHLISFVYNRQDVVALGKFSLNLSGVPSDDRFVSRFYDIISNLVTKSHLLPLSLSNMNSLKFIPRKDYKRNRLETGMLQLSVQTHLVIDETALEPGQLDSNGVENMTALGTVMSWQTIDYDFNYHKQNFPTDIIMLVFSEGKSILKCDCHVPVVAMNNSGCMEIGLDELFKGLNAYLTAASLESIRTYLGKVHLLTFNLSETMQKVFNVCSVSQ